MVASFENPTPMGCSRPGEDSAQHWELMTVDQQDEDAYLRDLTGVESLEAASSLRCVVNTAVTTMSHLGRKLPHLQELNLSGSILESVRDLGTGFRTLQVLWLSRCGLNGLEGLSALPSLRELYAAYNDISDLQPLDSCQELEVLDMEANCIEDLDCLHVLSASCPKLQNLSLAGNPVSASPDYHASAMQLMAGLRYLDDTNVLHLRHGNGNSRAANNADGAGAVLSLSASGSLPGVSDAGMPDSELLLVRDGIKHARVGVDSAEFRELEMTLLMAAEMPPEGAQPSSSMLPVSTSSWLRCSQQGSLPGLLRSRSSGGHGTPSRASSGGSASSSSRFAPGPMAELRINSSGQGGGTLLQQQQQLNHFGSGNGRPPTARPFSARPGTASGARPGTASTVGSAPPTAGPGSGAGSAGGLYWKKNRLGSGGSSSSKTLGATLDEEEEDSGSALTFGMGGAAIGGSLAKDLRRRKRASAWESASTAGGSSLLDPVSGLGVSYSRGSFLLDPVSGLGVSYSRGGDSTHAASGKAALGSAAAAAAGRSKGSTLGASYDTAALMEELRQWKMDTADRALLPAEDEVVSAAWQESPSDTLAEVADFEQMASMLRDSSGDGDAMLHEPEQVRHDAHGSLGGADVLSLGRVPEPIVVDSPAPTSALGALPLRSLVAQQLAATHGLLSPNGRPPSAVCASPAQVNGKYSSLRLADAEGGWPLGPSPSAVFSPKAQLTGLHQLGPVHGHRPVRLCKMTLCKVLHEANGKELRTGASIGHRSTGQEGLSIKSRPGLSDFLNSSRDNPLFASLESGGSPAARVPGHGQGALRVLRPPLEVDIKSLNPQPVVHIEDSDSDDGS